MNKYLLLLLLCCFCIPVFSQSIVFTYDANGNRIKRELTSGLWKTSNTIKGEEDKSADSLFAEALKIKVYPNPAKEYLTVNLGSIDETQSTISLLDINGKEIYTQVTTLNQLQVDVSHIAPGTYLLKVTRGENFVMYNIIKQ